MNDDPEIHAIAMLAKQMMSKSNATSLISEHHEVRIDNYINWEFDQINENECHLCDKRSCIYIHDNTTHVNTIYCMSCFEKNTTTTDAWIFKIYQDPCKNNTLYWKFACHCRYCYNFLEDLDIQLHGCAPRPWLPKQRYSRYCY